MTEAWSWDVTPAWRKTPRCPGRRSPCQLKMIPVDSPSFGGFTNAKNPTSFSANPSFSRWDSFFSWDRRWRKDWNIYIYVSVYLHIVLWYLCVYISVCAHMGMDDTSKTYHSLYNPHNFEGENRRLASDPWSLIAPWMIQGFFEGLKKYTKYILYHICIIL